MAGLAVFVCCGWAGASVGVGALALSACGHSSGGTAPETHKGYPSAAASPAAAPTAAAAPATSATPTLAAVPPTPAAVPAPVATAPAPEAQGTPLQPASAPQATRGYEPPMPTAQPSPPGALRFSVRGVDHNDVLNVRSAPGPKHPVVGEIPPEATGVVATGARRQVGPAVWREVTYGNVRGWVNERFLVEEREVDPNRGGGDRR